MPTKPASPAPLRGQALADISGPLTDTPRGGSEFGFDGSNTPAPKGEKQTDPFTGTALAEQDFAGLGSWLEDPDAAVFQTANNLVLRQELLAINRLSQDVHFTRIKLGFPFSILEKDPNRDTYKSSLPVGTKSLSIQAVPNQAWDLVNKATEAVLSDPPQLDPSPLDDSEQAHAAAEMAERFLTEDAGENGTNDTQLLFDAVDKALVCATSYVELFTDPVGGGYVPLQVLAHPTAASPDNPLIGADGMPTPNPILRYVTAPTGGQFTDQPSQAAPQWQPKIRANLWGREHWRIFPETTTVTHAEKAIGLLYCTLAEAKRRWPSVAQMPQDELEALLGWQPVRFLVLLPSFERARWRVNIGADNEKSGSGDERLMFYYRVLQKASPDHKKGAEVCVTGAFGGRILDRKLLAATVQVPGKEGGPDVEETRCMDLPLVQFTPRADPDDRDPTGRCYIEMFCGATEMNATLATGFLQALNQWLNPDSYVFGTSTVQGYQRAESRATGDAIPIAMKDDMPQWGQQPPIPPTFFTALEWNDQAIRSIGSLPKPITGQDTSKEVSGKARQIAVQQGMVGLSRMGHPTNSAYERFGRLKVQMAMRDFSTPQTLRYVGEDGSWQESQWKGTDFALVGSVGIQAGTGTMLPPEQKIQFLSNLKNDGMLPPDDAADAARPTFAQRLGLPDDPHEQYVERCVAAWLKGPPQGWDQLWQQYTVAVQQEQAAYTQAVGPMQAAGQPVPPFSPKTPMPYTPFVPHPNDSEPPIAQRWMKRLSRVQSTVKYDTMKTKSPQWVSLLDQRYSQAVQVMQAVAAAQAAAQQPPPNKPDDPSQANKPNQPAPQ